MTEKEEQAKVDAIFDEYLQEKKREMREILFRGKREDNDEWVCGYYAEVGLHKMILTGRIVIAGDKKRITVCVKEDEK